MLLAAVAVVAAPLPAQPPTAPQPGTQQPGTQQPQPGPPQAPPAAAPLGPPAPGAQDPAGQNPQNPADQNPGVEVLVDPRAQPLLGRTIRVIRVLQVDRDGLRPMTDDAADAITRHLASRAGQRLELRLVTGDIGNLWHERRLAVRAFARPDRDQVELWLIVELEVQVYERVEFQGLRRFPRVDVEALLGLYPDRQVTSTEAQAMRNILIARYRREGYAFANIDLDEREPDDGESSGERRRKIVTFRIDEGPKVQVRRLQFRGNASFPAETSTFFSPGDHLVRESHMKSTPGVFGGSPFSREVLEEDVDLLQLFYRSRGFLDAVVTTADVEFTADRSEVDLTFLVVEGPRYTIRSLEVVHIDAQGKEVAAGAELYPSADILAELKSHVGDFYDHTRIRRDQLAIEEFYGRRGHPKSSFPGMDRVPGAFRVGWPKESYDESAGVALRFEIFEGTEKTLRDVVIRGNSATRDTVIRRKVQALPGERIDMQKVQRSIAYLDQTRFFMDPLTLSGPRFELMPVPGRDDLLDLAIDVDEAPTGEFRWGVGISSGAGAQATLTFHKRNFDLWSPPSSWNPVTAIAETLGSRAFHGGGQELDLLLAPGTQLSQFQISYTEPDLFAEYFDTTELRVNGRRTLLFRDGYRADTLGAELGLSRRFGEEVQVGLSFQQETVRVRDLSADATSLAFDAEGTTELRGPRATVGYRDLDDRLFPTRGLEAVAAFEMLGGPFGGGEDQWKAELRGDLFTPLFENDIGHRTVLHLETDFRVAEAFGGSQNVFVTERYYLGGSGGRSPMRGFEFRGVGPSQFNRPFGGEAMLRGTAEITFPLVATRLERDLRDRELLRGVAFVDYGLLGLDINDPTFQELRLSYGIGIRINVPMLELPIALDLGWPILAEETDRTRQLLFTISR